MNVWYDNIYKVEFPDATREMEATGMVTLTTLQFPYMDVINDAIRQ